MLLSLLFAEQLNPPQHHLGNEKAGLGVSGAPKPGAVAAFPPAASMTKKVGKNQQRCLNLKNTQVSSDRDLCEP